MKKKIDIKEKWKNSTNEERKKIWKSFSKKQKSKYVSSKDSTLLFDYFTKKP